MSAVEPLPVAEDVASAAYVVVHLVVQESLKDLLGPQVIDHMAHQATTDGLGRPARIMVGLLEPGRVAISERMRRRLAELRSRTPEVRVGLLPYVSRLGIETSARLLAGRIRRFARGLGVVFHCRGEAAAEWAMALVRHVDGAGIITDVRGAWPEELLFARGLDGPAEADGTARRDYEGAMDRLRLVLARSGAVLTVSDGLVDWLRDLGVDDTRLFCIPCCVPRVTFTAADRMRMRVRLGLNGKLVWCYAGTITRYQHIEDGLMPFFRIAAEQCATVHLLALTNEPERMHQIAGAAGVPADRTTICRIPQHELSRYLAAADAGLLLRGPSRVNRFSQPTKLGEYLAAGLPVIVSRGTGTVDTLVEQAGAGIAVDAFSADRSRLTAGVVQTCLRLQQNGEQMRQNALTLCEQQFLWSGYTDVVRIAYRLALDGQHGSGQHREREQRS